MEGVSVPEIVGSYTATGLTTALASTTVFSTLVDGTYRISLYSATSDTNSGHGYEIDIDWTDEFRSQSVPLTVTGQSGSFGGYVQATVIARIPASTDIKTATFASGGGLAEPYDIFIVVERL